MIRQVKWFWGSPLVLVLAVTVCACSREEAKEAPPEKPLAQIAECIPAGAARHQGENCPEVEESDEPDADDERTDLSPVDRKTLKTVEKAMEDDDVRALRAAVPAALKSQETEVRSATVDALAWFGEKTMDDLLPFMSDSDEDIAESALNGWTAALGEIEDEKRKCNLVESVMKVLKNEEALESLVMELNDCEDIVALPSVVNLIQCDNPSAVKVAREHYEFMTGDEFTTVEAAEAWAKENCSDDTESQDKVGP